MNLGLLSTLVEIQGNKAQFIFTINESYSTVDRTIPKVAYGFLKFSLLSQDTFIGGQLVHL